MLGSLFAQFEDNTSLDKMLLIDGTVFEGEYISMNEENIIFKPSGYPAGQSIDRNIVKLVELADGTIIFKIQNEKIKSNFVGVGVTIDKYPIVSMPIKLNNFLFEPTVGFKWEDVDSISTNTFDLSLAIYYNFPSNNNFNFLMGISTGLLINNTFIETDLFDYKISKQNLVSSIKIGFQYKISEDFFLSYETAYQISKDNGGYYKYSWEKEKFESTDAKISKIVSCFIIRYYLN